MSASERGLNQAWWALKIGLGATAFLAGLDKFVGVLADWGMYLSPTIERFLPMSPGAFLQVVGVVEMLAGLLVLSRYTRLGAYVVAAWLLAIAAQLLTTGMFFDLAVRDVVLALAAFALARLSEWRSVRPARAGA
jgi:hypothetical protein